MCSNVVNPWQFVLSVGVSDEKWEGFITSIAIWLLLLAELVGEVVHVLCYLDVHTCMYTCMYAGWSLPSNIFFIFTALCKLLAVCGGR